MPFLSTTVPGSWVYHPNRHLDVRGFFQEDFKMSGFEEQLGFNFQPSQANRSMSKAGVIRGIHWADNPPGQAKLITCTRGAIWDVVVDLRIGSPSFAKWHAQELSAENGQSMFISAGLGHGFLALENFTTVSYLCSTEYNPTIEHSIHPLDETLSIGFEERARMAGISELTVTENSANTLQKALESKVLPIY